MSLDSEGNIDWITDKSFIHEGSYDTRILVRAISSPYSSSVRVSGNVGAYSRPDNVFGYDFDTLIIKLNQLMSDLELPQFTAGDFMMRPAKDGTATPFWTGATVSRLDLTANYETGSPENAHHYLYYLAGNKPTRMRTTARGDTDTIETVSHGSRSSYRTAIVYNKAAEFKKRKRKSLHLDYYKRLLEYLENSGVIRLEIRLKQRYLTQNSLRYLGQITMKDLQQIFAKTSHQVITSFDVSAVNDLSNAAYSTYQRWKSGYMVQLSKATFYRHRREILDTLGLDISNKFDSRVIEFPVKAKVIHIKPAQPPEHYHLPSVAFRGTQSCLNV